MSTDKVCLCGQNNDGLPRMDIFCPVHDGKVPANNNNPVITATPSIGPANQSSTDSAKTYPTGNHEAEERFVERHRLGLLVRTLRGSMSQTEFGALYGVSHAAVSDWERSVSDVPGNVTLALIARERTAAEQAGWERGTQATVQSMLIMFEHLLKKHEPSFIGTSAEQALRGLRTELAALQPPQSGEKL